MYPIIPLPPGWPAKRFSVQVSPLSSERHMPPCGGVEYHGCRAVLYQMRFVLAGERATHGRRENSSDSPMSNCGASCSFQDAPPSSDVAGRQSAT